MVHHERCQLRSDVSWTSVDETRNVRSMDLARLQVLAEVWKLTTFVRRGLPFPLAFAALATRHSKFSITGWLSQAIKSTNADNKKIASGTLDTRHTCFLKTATC